MKFKSLFVCVDMQSLFVLSFFLHKKCASTWNSSGSCCPNEMCNDAWCVFSLRLLAVVISINKFFDVVTAAAAVVCCKSIWLNWLVLAHTQERLVAISLLKFRITSINMKHRKRVLGSFAFCWHIFFVYTLGLAVTSHWLYAGAHLHTLDLRIYKKRNMDDERVCFVAITTKCNLRASHMPESWLDFVPVSATPNYTFTRLIWRRMLYIIQMLILAGTLFSHLLSLDFRLKNRNTRTNND